MKFDSTYAYKYRFLSTNVGSPVNARSNNCGKHICFSTDCSFINDESSDVDMALIIPSLLHLPIAAAELIRINARNIRSFHCAHIANAAQNLMSWVGEEIWPGKGRCVCPQATDVIESHCALRSAIYKSSAASQQLFHFAIVQLQQL